MYPHRAPRATDSMPLHGRAAEIERGMPAEASVQEGTRNEYVSPHHRAMGPALRSGLGRKKVGIMLALPMGHEVGVPDPQPVNPEPTVRRCHVEPGRPPASTQRRGLTAYIEVSPVAARDLHLLTRRQRTIDFERYLKSGSGRAFANKHLW